MYCMGVDHVELTVMLFVASVKHLYHSLSQLFWISWVQAALPKVSSSLNPSREILNRIISLKMFLRKKKVKCQYFKSYFLYVGQ